MLELKLKDTSPIKIESDEVQIKRIMDELTPLERQAILDYKKKGVKGVFSWNNVLKVALQSLK